MIRSLRLTLAVLVCALPAACAGDQAEPPDGVDDARFAAVRADPALAGGVARPATVETGSSNFAYLRAQVALTTAADPAARVAAAREAGWRVTFVDCPNAPESGPIKVAQAFKTMPAPAAGGGTYTVGLRIEDGRATAVIPYHLDAADPFGAPPAGVSPEHSCLETPGAPLAGREVEISLGAPRVRS